MGGGGGTKNYLDGSGKGFSTSATGGGPGLLICMLGTATGAITGHTNDGYTGVLLVRIVVG